MSPKDLLTASSPSIRATFLGLRTALLCVDEESLLLDTLALVDTIWLVLIVEFGELHFGVD
jgi:hypothetical protein